MLALTLITLANVTPASMPAPKIDRHALVQRHNVTLTKFDGERPLQVGNGEFAFGMDITGLQTFAPFNTMSHWAWHSSPLPAGVKIEDFAGQVWDTHGRPIRYPMADPEHPEISAWLAGNPHRINLGRVGLILRKRDGSEATAADLQHPRQTLDLWSGVVTSTFELEGVPVKVTTAANPDVDAIASKVESTLAMEGRLDVFVSCPGNNPLQFANFVGDWANQGKLDRVGALTDHSASFVRHLDDTTYHVCLRWDGNVSLKPPSEEVIPFDVTKAEYGANDTWVDVRDALGPYTFKDHLAVPVGNNLAPDPILGVRKTLKITYVVAGRTFTASGIEGETLRVDPVPTRNRILLQPKADRFAFTCAFAREVPMVPSPNSTLEASRTWWPKFWKSGGAIDLSQSTDPRWKELERRVVLSQYLMAVNEAGSYPPQESGLVNNGWFGRFHMEMVWWHAAHYALWNRWSEVNPSFTIYDKLLKNATQLAKSEGYKGARWPKCIGPNLREWPHEIHSLLIWQQPHPIFFAELDYRAHPTKATLKKWAPVVEATADFMASYAFFDEGKKRYVLGPPLQVVSENAEPRTAMNPSFELGYWRFGLRTAQVWRERMGKTPNPEWEKVLDGLSPLPEEDGLYVLHEGVPNMWTKYNFEHPGLTGAFGLLPGDGVDRATMARTLDKIVTVWDFNQTWGWDFPMLAMCAARLGEPDRAIAFLLTKAPGFQFDERGLATGGPFPYFPSNGGLLYAVAMMAAGWEGAPKGHAPGFPAGARWKVKFEGLSRAL